jgi:hypothetical protein
METDSNCTLYQAMYRKMKWTPGPLLASNRIQVKTSKTHLIRPTTSTQIFMNESAKHSEERFGKG